MAGIGSDGCLPAPGAVPLPPFHRAEQGAQRRGDGSCAFDATVDLDPAEATTALGILGGGILNNGLAIVNVANGFGGFGGGGLLGLGDLLDPQVDVVAAVFASL